MKTNLVVTRNINFQKVEIAREGLPKDADIQANLNEMNEEAKKFLAKIESDPVNTQPKNPKPSFMQPKQAYQRNPQQPQQVYQGNPPPPHKRNLQGPMTIGQGSFLARHQLTLAEQQAISCMQTGKKAASDIITRIKGAEAQVNHNEMNQYAQNNSPFGYNGNG